TSPGVPTWQPGQQIAGGGGEFPSEPPQQPPVVALPQTTENPPVAPTDQPSPIPVPLPNARPGEAPSADKTVPPPDQKSGLQETQAVRDARDYLIATATPGGTMMALGKGDGAKGAKEAIDRLNPEFATRLAAAVKEARAAGIPVSIMSAYRAPSF